MNAAITINDQHARSAILLAHTLTKRCHTCINAHEAALQHILTSLSDCSVSLFWWRAPFLQEVRDLHTIYQQIMRVCTQCINIRSWYALVAYAINNAILQYIHILMLYYNISIHYDGMRWLPTWSQEVRRASPHISNTFATHYQQITNTFATH